MEDKDKLYARRLREREKLDPMQQKQNTTHIIIMLLVYS